MRKRAKFHARVRALTGEGRMQAAVLIALPLVALAALYTLNRPYAQVLLDRPRLLLATGMSQTVGAFFIHRIVNFKF
jgi:tight adherence protein B